MKWLRFLHQEQVGIGTLEGDVIHVHEGNFFLDAHPTGKTLSLSSVTVITPCQPTDRKSTRLNSSHSQQSRMPSSA